MSIVKVEILDREVTRKEFLTILAGSGLALFGFNNFIAFLQTVTAKPAQSSTNSPDSFGTRKFGV